MVDSTTINGVVDDIWASDLLSLTLTVVLNNFGIYFNFAIFAAFQVL